MKTERRFASEGRFKDRGTGRIGPERLVDFGRNQRPVSAGTRGRIGRNEAWRPTRRHRR